jgi:hypothetical protein
MLGGVGVIGECGCCVVCVCGGGGVMGECRCCVVCVCGGGGGVCGGRGWLCVVVSPCARTFQGLHSLRHWTPTILYVLCIIPKTINTKLPSRISTNILYNCIGSRNIRLKALKGNQTSRNYIPTENT